MRDGTRTEELKGPMPIAKRMLAVLSDGKPHAQEELRRCIENDLSDTFHLHIHFLRKHIRQAGFDVVGRHSGGTKYWMLVRPAEALTKKQLKALNELQRVS